VQQLQGCQERGVTTADSHYMHWQHCMEVNSCKGQGVSVVGCWMGS
jgi:hypothetical protein